MPSSIPSLPSTLTFILLLLYDQMCPLFVLSNKDVMLPSFSWDPRNECFNASKNKNGKDYAHIKADQESQIYFICPSVAITYDVQTKYTKPKSMYENMFMCTKDEFTNCRLGKRTDKTRLVMKCDDPLDIQKLKYKHFSFARVRSRMDGFAFEAGQTYYFIATSNGSQGSLDDSERGRCATDNMRLAITICEHGQNCHLSNTRCNRDDVKSKDPQLPQLSQPLTVPSIQPNIKETINEKEKPTILRNRSINVSDTPSAQHSKRPDDSSMGKKNIMYITLAAIGGLFVGILLTAGIWTIKRASRKKNTNRYSGAPSTTTEHVEPVDDAEEQREEDTNSGSVKIEVMNQKYFTSVDYRNSNEFHRLISTTSTCSSHRHSDGERHCVTPVGGYK